MNKVAKTVKKLRMQNSLTQEALAEQLNVTRQTVSGWENNRTQPDIETLTRLAEIFSVEIEELIYGAPRQEREKKTEPQKVIIVLFAVLGSLLIGSGLLIWFISGWASIPQFFKSAMAFIPMLCGQAVAFYTYRKRFDSMAWREGASVLWCAGSAATIALADSIFVAPTVFADCFLMDSFIFLPIIFLFDAVVPLVFYYAGVLVYAIYYLSATDSILFFIFALIMIAIGCIFSYRKRKNPDDVRYIYSVWLDVIAVMVLFAVLGYGIKVGFYTLVGLMFVALYMIDKGKNIAMPSNILGVLGSCFMSVFICILMRPGYYGIIKKKNIPPECIVIAVLCLAVLAFGLAVGKERLKKDKNRRLFCFCAISVSVLAFAAQLVNMKTVLYVIVLVLALVQSAVMIVIGANNGKFAPLNLGLVMVTALIFSVAFEFTDDMAVFGIVLALAGVAVLLVNRRFMKKQKQLEQQEVQSDE